METLKTAEPMPGNRNSPEAAAAEKRMKKPETESAVDEEDCLAADHMYL